MQALKIIIFALIVIQWSFFIWKKWDYIKDCIGSSAESPSIKRLVAFMATFALIESWLLNMLVEVPVQQYMWGTMAGIIGAALGLSAWEKISAFKTNDATPNNTEAKNENVNPIILLLVFIGLTSCNTEKQFVNHYVKHSDNAAHWCGIWFPPVINTVPGGSDTVFVNVATPDAVTNCDSFEVEYNKLKAYASAHFATLEQQNAWLSTQLKPNAIHTPCPPSHREIIHDTIIKSIENTAKIQDLQAQLDKAKQDKGLTEISRDAWKKRCTWLFVIDLIVIIGIFLYNKFKI